MSDWTETKSALPAEGKVVQAMDSSGRVTELVRKGSLWFIPDYSMYVYYVPQRWKEQP